MGIASLVISAMYLSLSVYYLYINLKTGVLVYIKNGPIVGNVQTTYGENKTYYSFRGIPYAKPPVGDLRFSAPVPPDNWIIPQVVTQDGNECYQSADAGSEDCLYLNVYTPAMNSSEKLPVMVWVYGGFFLTGNADYYSFGPDYFLEEDVVIVTLNYRLGVFGFLSCEDEEALGNWGLKDQLLALQWVQDNIEVFGGDTNSVTLFGQSAGAGAVSYLSLMEQTKGLIHRVILHSGTSISIWALSRQARDVAFCIGAALGINASDSKSLIQELRGINASALHVKSLETDLFSTLVDNPRNGLIFAPVIEPDHKDSVVTWKSHEKMAHGHFHHVPFIMGFNTEEAGKATSFIDWLRLFVFTYDLNPTKLVPIDMNLNESNTLIESLVALQIKAHYFGLAPAALSDDELIQKANLQGKKLKCITTDGGKNTCGKIKGLFAHVLKAVQNDDGGLKTIIHLQALCGKYLDMSIVSEPISSVKFIRSHSLIHRQFREFLEKFINDDQFVRPIFETARLMGGFTPVYLYRFSYVGEEEKAARGNDTMTFHGDELFWIWKLRDRSQDLNEADLQMRHKMLTLWTNFARYGDPTPDVDATLDSVTWNPVNPEDVYYLDMGEQLSMGNEWSNYSIDFWRGLYNTYGTPPYDTY